jgi:hypothetical protein
MQAVRKYSTMGGFVSGYIVSSLIKDSKIASIGEGITENRKANFNRCRDTLKFLKSRDSSPEEFERRFQDKVQEYEILTSNYMKERLSEIEYEQSSWFITDEKRQMLAKEELSIKEDLNSLISGNK